ncbi:hypothetical protein Cob_v001717 [Colletotrichum orbiculare MAFF 240422]|uniref:Uncharacterized protein n=1 Tax=Colletotrichum orbiculare (strain 104-T / ATCC 96160 / CBS 514.97 / LARS 414 / MAFF 240422) TaxID=1213857 RepID=A0A484G3Z6_COLOR|nr:hypothetical protein Cob_v001717 [Colletotrichum orbiculare MAFF 240422]
MSSNELKERIVFLLCLHTKLRLGSQDETKSADNHYMLGCVEDSIELVVQWQAKQKHTRTRMRFKQRSNFSEAMNVFKRTNGREGTNSSSNATRDMSHRDKQNSQQDKHTESSKSRVEHASDGGEIATRSNTSTWDIARPSAPPRQQASQSAPQKSQALSKAEQDEQFVARLKLLWDVRHVHEDIKRQIYQSPEAERQQLYKQKMEVLHQQVVELTQAALSRHGPSVCDLPYEKMEALFMRGK